jgi:spore coat polysaccharide biosynthesis protein SpsF (cytidylyltransferase family)
VLHRVGGRTVLEWVVHRARLASRAGEVVVAIPDLSRDDPLEELCAHVGVPCFRGSEQDVLDRYYRAARSFEAETVVRITSDCPLLDPGLLDDIVVSQAEKRADYVSADGVPKGVAQEVFTAEALERVWRDATLPDEREHVMVHYVTRHPDRFEIVMLPPPAGLELPSWRLTLDDAEDFELLEGLFDATDGALFGLDCVEIVGVVAGSPRLLELATREV